jgi:aminopeptidase N
LGTALVAAGMFSAAGSAAADAPFSFATTPGRLPKSVVPLEYHVTIVPRPASMTLDGSERVILDVRERTAQLVFNALNIRFRSARVDGQPAVAIDANDRTQRTTLRLARTLSRICGPARNDRSRHVPPTVSDRAGPGRHAHLDAIRVDRCAANVPVLG